MRLNTSSSENKKHPSKLRSSVSVERGETLGKIVEHPRVRIELLVLILREVIGLDVVAEAVLAATSAVPPPPAA